MTILRTTFRAALQNLIGPTIVSMVLVALAVNMGYRRDDRALLFLHIEDELHEW